MKAETSSGSDSDLSAVKKVLQQLDSMNLSSAELARMGVDLVAFDRYCQLLGL